MFFTIARSGMKKIKKLIYFRTLRHALKLSFAPGHGMFHGKRYILGHSTLHKE